jgi:3-oxoadipate enol-lactonase
MTEALHTVTSGDGGAAPAFLLLHSLAMDHTIWDAHAAALERVAPVVRPDLPGHGRSAAVGETSVESMADQVAAMLGDQPWDSYVVLGLSLGGCVAQALTIRHPELVAALCLVDTTAWYGEGAPEAWAARAAKARTEGFDSLSGFQLDRWFGPVFRSEHPEVGAALLDIFRANDIGSYEHVCAAMGAYDARPHLGEIAVPTRVLVGELDPATPLPHAELLAREIAGATLRVLPGAGHMSPIEVPDLIAAELVALRERASEPRASMPG